MGGWMVYREYSSIEVASLTSLALGLAMLIVPWIYYPIKHKKIGNEIMPFSSSQTDVALKREWELEYLEVLWQQEKEAKD
jgi:hypothetical protein